MIFPTKQDFIRHLASLEMGASVVVTNDHGATVEGIITHTLPGVAGHTVRYSHPKGAPEAATFAGAEWHWVNGLPAVLHGTRQLTRDELIFTIIDHTPVRQYGVTLMFSG